MVVDSYCRPLRACGKHIWMIAAIGCCTMLAGCGGTVPVHGTVMREGRAVSGGTVMFRPVGEGKPAFGPIQPDGSFELSTSASGDGAVVGEYRITVAGELDAKNSDAGVTYVGPRDKTFKITAGEKNEFTIDIRTNDGWRAVVDDD